MSPSTIVITGATAGFGAACARRFAAAGKRLLLIGRRAERLQELQQALAGLAEILTLALDVRQREAVMDQLGNLPAPFADVDVLVNNAGLALGLDPAQAADLDDWDAMVDTNIKGLTYCTRALLPHMVARNRGHIINLGSIAGTFPYPCGNTYGATKAFVHQFSRNLRTDLHGTPVRVTCLEPGLAESEFSIVRFKGDQTRAAKVYEGCQALLPDDIAEMIFWVSHLPPHVNVNVLEVMPTCQAWGPLAIHRDTSA